MYITERQKCIIEQVINVAETGKPHGDYSAIATMDDGPEGCKQISYGRSQVTETGQLRDLIEIYCDLEGKFKLSFEQYLPKIGETPLVSDKTFKALLKTAGKTDLIMKQAQDQFFEDRYFTPAKRWAELERFLTPLGLLIIYDSFIHSGGILKFLRNRFPEKTPANGGSESTWLNQYVSVRHDWLKFHHNPLLRNTIYRTECYKEQLCTGNWNLQSPILINGILVTETGG